MCICKQKESFQVGDSAYNALKRDKIKAMKNLNNSAPIPSSSLKDYVTNEKYHCSNLGKDLAPKNWLKF